MFISAILKSQKIDMKKKITTGILLIFSQTMFAQLTGEQRIQDSIIGWWSNNYWDREWKSPTDPIGKIKETHVNKMVEWMKKSYTPVGGLGTVTRHMRKSNFGVKFMVWNVSHDKQWTEPNGKFKPIEEENTKFYMMANMIFGSYPVSFINKDGVYLFTWQPDGYGNDNNDPENKKRPVGIHSNVSKYITVRNEMQTVYLAPGNKLPFAPVTKGELLKLADAALAEKHAKANEFDKKAIDRIRKNIAQLKEKHKSSLQQAAVIKDMQPSMYAFDGLDPFEISEILISRKQYYPVYKLTADVLEKMKLPQPQWVTVSLPFKSKEDGNQLYEMYTALTQNINYDYIYNYFFDPEKVKGFAYTPANEAQLNARLDAYRKKNKADNNATTSTTTWPPGAFFFDDFSAGHEGGAPGNWYYRTSSNHPKVTVVKNQPGKWLQLGYNNTVSPSLLKKPLPQNFTLEYDITTDGDFTHRTGGAVRLVLNTRKATEDGREEVSGNGTRIEINIVSGNEADYNNNNYRGEARIKINAMPAVYEQNYSEGIYGTFPLKEFTNKKTTVHVVVKIKNGILTILVNNKEVANSKHFKLMHGGDCKVCGIGSDVKFNTLYFTNITDKQGETRVYISNIKITKE
jgi:hypothetical protein